MIHKIEIYNARPKTLWSNFIDENRLVNLNPLVEEIQLDFSKCNFIEPFHLVALACLLEEYTMNGKRLTFLKLDNLELNDYLNNINFFKYWTPDFDRNTYTPTVKSTNLCLWKLDSRMISEYVLRAQEYFENNFLTDKSVEPLNISLAEAFNNINDHANSAVSGYCLSQYYPNIKKMKISVCDFGYGIPFVVNKYLVDNGVKPLSDQEAIIKSIEKSFSTKSMPHNRGFGLDTIRSIVESSNGRLRIRSNKGVVEMANNSINSYSLERSFGGTHIEIILDTSTFYEKEGDLIQDDFEF